MDLFSFEIDKGDISAIEDMDRGDVESAGLQVIHAW